MPDTIYVLGFVMLYVAAFGLGMYVGTNKANQRWNQHMRDLARKYR